MRIAITNWSNRIAGGAEEYLDAMADVLVRNGNNVCLWHQIGKPADRPAAAASLNLPTWDASRLGMDESIAELRKWQPDVVYCQGMLDPATEAELQKVAPSVFFAHDYHGTCISGSKTTMFPVIHACTRKFSAGCLLKFYPLRCGGLNPVTMLRDYDTNRRRLEVLANYDQVITHSGFLREEYKRNGIGCEQVRFFVRRDPNATPRCEDWVPGPRWNLLMLSRMTRIKGGEVLLEALPMVAARVSRSLSLTIAGDGQERARWESIAKQIQQKHPHIEIKFPGWLSGNERTKLFREAELILVPSLWPEPFGLTGLEAGLWGIPSVAFDVGGISSWLKDGDNGFLASSNPISASGLADTIIKCLADDERYRKMRSRALAISRQMNEKAHYEDVMQVFNKVLSGHPSTRKP